ncbi:MAG: lamin tail domain-containing protein [Anaerolineales bacterium]
MKTYGGYRRTIGYLFLVILTSLMFNVGCRKLPRRISICDLQGSGSISPFNRQEVEVSGVVIADLENAAQAGIFIQDTDCGSSQGNGTSSGVFVLYQNVFDRVSLGDEITVHGVVVDFYQETLIIAGEESVQILSVDNSLPEIVDLKQEIKDSGGSFDYESYEGMRVYLPAARVVRSADGQGNFWVLPEFKWKDHLMLDDVDVRGVLRITHDQTSTLLSSAVVGDNVQNLVGLLRQNQDGYFLQLLEPASVVLQPAPDSLLNIPAEEQSREAGEEFSGENQTAMISPQCTSTPTGTPTPYHVNLLITELLPNPKGTEPDGEWVEIYNPETYDLPLTGIKIGDETSPQGKEGMLRFPDGYYIGAKEVLVIAHKASTFRSTYGFFPDFELVDSDFLIPDLLPYPEWGGDSIQFSNGGDEVLLLDPWGRVVDLLSYGSSEYPAFKPAVTAPREGHTLERYPPEQDRDRAGDWRERIGGSPGKLDRSPPTPVMTPTTSPEPSQTPSPSLTKTSTPFIPSATPASIRLLLSEIMANPVGDEPEGEWIEIFNPEEEPMPLTGVKVGDAAHRGDPESMLVFPPGEVIDPGGLILIAHQAAVFEENYGFKPDYEVSASDPSVKKLIPYNAWAGGQIRLNNSGDELILLNGWDVIIDSLAYGSSGLESFQPPVPAAPEGRSLARHPMRVDTDSEGDWEVSEFPSPGKVNPGPPTSTPTITPSSSATPTLTATSSLTFTPEFTITFTLTPTFQLTPSFTVTSTLQGTPTATASLIVLPTPTETPQPSSSPSLTPLVSPSPTATAGSSATPSFTTLPTTIAETNTPSPTGITSLTPSPSSTSTPATTDTGSPEATITLTPEQPSDTPTPIYVEDEEIVLNEIHADPDQILGDANGDGVIHSDDDEFLELINLTDSVFDISDWVIADAVRIRYTFPPGTLLAGHCGLIIFGGGSPSGEFGGSLVLTAGSLALNNTGDTISIWDGDGRLRLRISYGSEGGLNQSLTRNPDLSGNFPLELHSEIPLAGGRRYSPGVKLDGSVFGTCP